jgi:hypothetical protein
MPQQGIDLHVTVPPTCEHGLSRYALIGKPAFLRHTLRRDIALGNDELHPMNFGTLKQVIGAERQGFGHDTLATLLGIKHRVADFQSIKIRDGLEEPNTAHYLIRWVDNEEPSVVFTPEPCLVKLPFERGFRQG